LRQFNENSFTLRQNLNGGGPTLAVQIQATGLGFPLLQECRKSGAIVVKETQTERQFWRYWLAGLMLFAVMIAMNPSISNLHAPMGISEHQAAGNAANVDAIQQQWQSDGVLWLARLSIAVDLIFIAVYSWGAWLGGRVMRASASPAAQRLGVLVMMATVLFCVTDYAETISQFVQAMQNKGSDVLAGVAATVRPIKSLAWVVTFTGLLAALLFRRMAARAA
jgi:hypothetical protein